MWSTIMVKVKFSKFAYSFTVVLRRDDADESLYFTQAILTNSIRPFPMTDSPSNNLFPVEPLLLLNKQNAQSLDFADMF